MVMKMNNYKPTVFICISILAVIGMLFGYVPKSYAQEGHDWTQPVNLSLSGIATDPMLVLDSANVLHAIWVDAVDGYKYSQSADSITWTKPQTVKYPFDKKGAPPVMLSDANGSIYIFWISIDAGLFYVKTTPSGITNPSSWQSTNNRIARNVVNYDVILDSQDVLHVAYINKVNTDANPAGVYYTQSIVGGGLWSGEIKLYESDYFRSTTESDSFIRIATSNTFPDQNVYVVWDSRAEKRVFMAVSNDSGLNWNESQQIIDAEDTGGVDSPFNLNVAAVNNNVLLMWQEGQPESAKCAVFSQWSKDNGENWGDIVAVLGGRTDCPISSKFIIQKKDYIVAMMTGQVDPTLIAWNGEQWSNPQIQTRLPAFSNPLTYESILLGCRFDLIHQNRLYVAGCDQGKGGDIWFLSRSLEPVVTWFSVSKTWGVPFSIPGKLETISSLSSVSDASGNIHSIWVQPVLSDNGSQKFAIEYTRWDGKKWTNPEPVISSLDGVPLQMSFVFDARERLLLSWVDGESGDFLFSWASLDSGNAASNWITPVGISSPSALVDSPDIVVDASGRIAIVYAVPLNENRGIYIAQSTDTGKSWSTPVRVFDAVSARWEKIGNPKISLSADGVLHLIFSRNSVRAGQSVGLYYSSSMDGGTTWSDSQILSEGDIRWSEIVSYGETIQVLWQEYDGLVVANLSQISQDGGVFWDKTLDITGVNDSSAPVALAADGSGNLHFIQLLKNNNATTTTQDNLILQDWKWTGSSWEFASSSNIVIRGQGKNYALTADITSDGFLGVSISAEYSDFENIMQNEILSFNRFLDDATTSDRPMVALIPTPVVLSNATETSDTLPTQPVDLSELYDNNVAGSSRMRNVIGIIIIAIAMVATIVMVMRGSYLKSKK